MSKRGRKCPKCGRDDWREYRDNPAYDRCYCGYYYKVLPNKIERNENMFFKNFIKGFTSVYDPDFAEMIGAGSAMLLIMVIMALGVMGLAAVFYVVVTKCVS